MTESMMDNYNPLYDVHLRQYFALPHMRRHLRKMGLIQDDEGKGDEVYQRHHAMMEMIIKNRETQLMKMAELRRKLDAAEKVETCRRIRSGLSPESYRRTPAKKASRSLSRGRRNSGNERQRRFSNSYDDKEVLTQLEQQYAEPSEQSYTAPRDAYKRLSANVKKYNYLHKMDDPTLISYKDTLKKQLDRLERFREVTFGVHSVVRQPPPPQTSWFFRRRSLPSLTSSAPVNALSEPLRSINNLRGRRHSPHSKSDNRTSCPPTTRKRKDSNPRFPPIASKGKATRSPSKRPQQPAARLPPAASRPAAPATRGRSETKKETRTSINRSTTSTITKSSVLPAIAGATVLAGAATAAIASFNEPIIKHGSDSNTAQETGQEDIAALQSEIPEQTDHEPSPAFDSSPQPEDAPYTEASVPQSPTPNKDSPLPTRETIISKERIEEVVQSQLRSALSEEVEPPHHDEYQNNGDSEDSEPEYAEEDKAVQEIEEVFERKIVSPDMVEKTIEERSIAHNDFDSPIQERPYIEKYIREQSPTPVVDSPVVVNDSPVVQIQEPSEQPIEHKSPENVPTPDVQTETVEDQDDDVQQSPHSQEASNELIETHAADDFSTESEQIKTYASEEFSAEPEHVAAYVSEEILAEPEHVEAYASEELPHEPEQFGASAEEPMAEHGHEEVSEEPAYEPEHVEMHSSEHISPEPEQIQAYSSEEVLSEPEHVEAVAQHPVDNENVETGSESFEATATTGNVISYEEEETKEDEAEAHVVQEESNSPKPEELLQDETQGDTASIAQKTPSPEIPVVIEPHEEHIIESTGVDDSGEIEESPEVTHLVESSPYTLEEEGQVNDVQIPVVVNEETESEPIMDDNDVEEHKPASPQFQLSQLEMQEVPTLSITPPDSNSSPVHEQPHPTFDDEDVDENIPPPRPVSPFVDRSGDDLRNEEMMERSYHYEQMNESNHITSEEANEIETNVVEHASEEDVTAVLNSNAQQLPEDLNEYTHQIQETAMEVNDEPTPIHSFERVSTQEEKENIVPTEEQSDEEPPAFTAHRSSVPSDLVPTEDEPVIDQGVQEEAMQVSSVQLHITPAPYQAAESDEEPVYASEAERLMEQEDDVEDADSMSTDSMIIHDSPDEINHMTSSVYVERNASPPEHELAYEQHDEHKNSQEINSSEEEEDKESVKAVSPQRQIHDEQWTQGNEHVKVHTEEMTDSINGHYIHETVTRITTAINSSDNDETNNNDGKDEAPSATSSVSPPTTASSHRDNVDDDENNISSL